MSFNQSRAERSDSSQYRRSGRSGSSAQPKNFSGGSGKGGGGGPAPPPSINSSLSSNRSYKKSHNAQGGQSRGSGAVVNTDSNYASAVRTLQNGAHLQPSAHGAADAPVGVSVKPTADMSTQKSPQAVPKAPSSQPSTVNSDSTAPATPAKASGEASKSFPLQFGSISPGFMNGMQIPARTNSAPPNLDEQQCDQARHDSLRTVPAFPIPSVPKKQMPRKDGDAGDQSNTGEAHQTSKVKRDVQVSSASPISQTQKASVHRIPGVSMPMPFHPPPVPVQFSGPNTQIHSQGMAATSLPVPMPMPLPMGNAPQLQQSVFVHSLPPHPMQPQGIMHQGQSLNFPPQMGPHMPPQLGNMGIGIGPQFAQHQAGKFGVQRITVKITDPRTHEELRLGSSGPRSNANVPQSQPITSVSPAHPITYYANSYNPNSLYFPAPSSVSLTGTQINPSSQVPRFSYPVSQSTLTLPVVNPSAHNSYSGKSSAPSASVQITVKQATGLHVAKIADSSQVVGSTSIERDESPTIVQQPREASSKDKPVLELGRSKSNMAGGKKKRKEILQKADAAGTTSDLYMAYKGPEERKETFASSESITGTSSMNLKQVLVDAAQNDVEKARQSKPEPGDWEDAAEVSTLKLDTEDDGKQVRGGLKHHSEDGNGVTEKKYSRKYSRDFLLKFSKQCTDLLDGFEITSDVAGALMVSSLNASRESHTSPGRIIDRPSMVSRLDRRGSGLGEDEKWNKLPAPVVPGQDPRMDGYGVNFRPGQVRNHGVLKNPRAQTPPQYSGGILPTPMQPQGSQGDPEEGIKEINDDELFISDDEISDFEGDETDDDDLVKYMPFALTHKKKSFCYFKANPGFLDTFTLSSDDEDGV